MTSQVHKKGGKKCRHSDITITFWYFSAGVGFDRNVLHGTIYRCWLVAKVPVHWIKQLHGLLVRPDRVDDKCKQSEASEEEHKLWHGHVGGELSPVSQDYPPHVIGEHHAAVERMDHHPLVGSPKESARPASLSEKKKGGQIELISCF